MFVASLTVASPKASAYHLNGYAYTGAHAKGGLVVVFVSADGASVTFEAFDIPGQLLFGGSCNITSHSSTATITAHAFTDVNPAGSVDAYGSFSSPGTVSGTLEGSATPQGAGCLTGVVNWSATTPVSPDSDLDGVPDYRDVCPQPANTLNGCPAGSTLPLPVGGSTDKTPPTAVLAARGLPEFSQEKGRSCHCRVSRRGLLRGSALGTVSVRVSAARVYELIPTSKRIAKGGKSGSKTEVPEEGAESRQARP